MFESKTVFVIGAGASEEVGLPVGGALTKRISAMLDIRFDDIGMKAVGSGDFALFYQLTRDRIDLARDLQQAAWLIRDGIVHANSIDDFLERHQADSLAVHYGKAAIVKAILEAEKQSKLYTDRSRSREGVNWDPISDTWFNKLFRMLSVGIKNTDVDGIFSNVSFIGFNYDRCLQQFLVEAIQPAYGIDLSTARKIVASARILHAYGSVGGLCADLVQHEVPFGSVEYGIPNLQLLEGIRTYGEESGLTEHLMAIRKEIADAETLVFLGFGFHGQNMRLLQPHKGSGARRVFATAFGMSEPDTRVVKDDVWSLLKGNRRTKPKAEIIIQNGIKCTGLFDAYSKSLPTKVQAGSAAEADSGK